VVFSKRQARAAHDFSIPLLAAPAQSLIVNEAGTGAAAAFVFHGCLLNIHRRALTEWLWQYSPVAIVKQGVI